MPASETHTSLSRLSWGRAAALQVAPGAANLLVFIPLAAWFGRLGLPSLLALAITLLVAEVPLSWILMARITREESGRAFRFEDAFPWRARMPGWQYLAIGLPLIIFGMVMIGGVTPAISLALRDAAGLDVPAWFLLEPDPAMFTQLPQAVLLTLWLMTLLSFAVVGGVTQELYARGFLLPRTAHWGWSAPFFNALLFAVLHLNAPWSWPGFFLLSLPWALLAFWKRSVWISLVGHVGMLLMQSLLMATLVFGLVSPQVMQG